MLKKERLEETFNLISRHLVKSHIDKDDNSMFVRFSEMMQHIEELQLQLDGWNRINKFLQQHKRKGECTMFEKAARKKIRFDSPQGQLSVEDLFDLPLTTKRNNQANLDDIAIALDKQLKDANTTSFVKKTITANEIAKLKFDILLHVIEVRMAEDEAAEQRKVNADKKQRLQALIAQKEMEADGAKSVEELRAELSAMIDSL
jgi:hypothetical protein